MNNTQRYIYFTDKKNAFITQLRPTLIYTQESHLIVQCTILLIITRLSIQKMLP